MQVNNILCEYLKNPLGIGIKSPRITWNVDGLIKQSAYEIIYYVNDVKKTSSIIESDSMFYVFKEEFQSKDIIKYQIRVRDENKRWSELSLINYFEMGLLTNDDWKAFWISGDYKANKNKRYPVDYFKKEFNANNIKKARLYISACGLYEAFINNKRVGNFILAPGSTDYRKRIQYQTYDVTSYIKNNN